MQIDFSLCGHEQAEVRLLQGSAALHATTGAKA